ncbi:MAG TPA: AAA family ATPase [Acidimicrobiales bacterium]|nr:AAA family ATPase [Acidimicrobiales bacterium]
MTRALRIAVAGKGGAGKTTLSATLSRLVARQGRSVLVIDADSNPNVAVALGISQVAAAAISPLPMGLVSRRLDGAALNDPVSTIVERFGARGPDGVAVVHMAMPAHADEGCLCSAHATVSAILADTVNQTDSVTLVDFEASPEHFSRGTTRHVDALLLVAEPYYRSLETARRMGELAAELPIGQVAVVANKLRSPDDLEAMEEFFANHNMVVQGRVPWSDSVLDADKAGTPLIDYDPDGPVVAAVAELVQKLTAVGTAAA